MTNYKFQINLNDQTTNKTTERKWIDFVIMRRYDLFCIWDIMQTRTMAQPRVIEVKDDEVIISIPRFLFKCEHEIDDVSDLSNREKSTIIVKPTAHSE